MIEDTPQKRLKSWVRANFESIGECAEYLGMKNYQTLQRYFKGDAILPIKYLIKLEKKGLPVGLFFQGSTLNDVQKHLQLVREYHAELGIKQNELTNLLPPVPDIDLNDIHEITDEINRIKNQNKPLQIPSLISSSAAGTGTPFDDGIEFIELPIRPDMISNIKEPFITTVYGDSMLPLLKQGDKVIVDSKANVKNGDIVVINLNDDTYIKEWMQSPSGYKLVSINTDYKAIPITEFDSFRIIGVVKSIFRNL